MRETTSDSSRPRTFTCAWPRKSRVTAAIAAAFTTVERWIYQNASGSRPSRSSRIGVLMSASPSHVTTRVYFSSDWK